MRRPPPPPAPTARARALPPRQVSDLEWSWACVVDLLAGACFACELALGFHASVLAGHGGRQVEVKGGRAVARFYVRRGTFWQDLVGALVWLVQVKWALAVGMLRPGCLRHPCLLISPGAAASTCVAAAAQPLAPPPPQIALLLAHHAGGVPLRSSAAAFQYVRLVRLLRLLAILRQLFALSVGAGGGAPVLGLRVPPRAAHAAHVAFFSLALVHLFACLW